MSARALLKGPRFPDELEYLWEWSLALHGQSGIGMAGLMPLNYSTIIAWRDLEEIDVQPHEVQALLILDRSMLYPSEEEDK